MSVPLRSDDVSISWNEEDGFRLIIGPAVDMSAEMTVEQKCLSEIFLRCTGDNAAEFMSGFASK